MEALRRLTSSMKALTALLTLLTAFGGRFGLNITPEEFWAVIAVGTVLIGAQGATDHGRGAAEIHAETALAAKEPLPLEKPPAP